MSAFVDGPCEAWTPLWCAGATPVTGAPVQAASEILWAMSGRRFGTCEVTVRPCRIECPESGWWAGVGWTGGGPVPALIGGQWFNLTCGACYGACSCGPVSEVALPAPVAEVVTVRVDGGAIPTGSYRVDDHRLLVRTDGAVWPRCNDLSLNDTEPGTWSVTVQVGEAVPVLGQLAVAELAAEIGRACAGEDCKLPQRVQTLARQGVTISFPDPEELSENGWLGLPLSDRFLMTFNPKRLPARSRVYSIDHPAPRRAGT